MANAPTPKVADVAAATAPAASVKIAIKPGEGRRLICPAGCRTLAGLPIARGTDMPAEGAVVPRGIWSVRSLGNGDAVLVPEEAVAAAVKSAPAAGAAPAQTPSIKPSGDVA